MSLARWLTLGVWLLAAPLFAQDAANPNNSAVRNANPNSRQGTAPPSTVPGSRVPQVQPRQPTVSNGGIGNGENIRRSAPPITAPSAAPRRQ